MASAIMDPEPVIKADANFTRATKKFAHRAKRILLIESDIRFFISEKKGEGSLPFGIIENYRE
jgi:hypothetical protein